MMPAKRLLRGGWGIYYSHYSGNIPGDLSRGPYAATTVTTNNIVNGVPQITLANPFSIPGTPGTLALSAVTPDLLNSYTQQYSVSLEREVTRDIGVRVSFIGSKGSQLRLPARRESAGGEHFAVQQCAASVPAIRQHQLRG